MRGRHARAQRPLRRVRCLRPATTLASLRARAEPAEMARHSVRAGRGWADGLLVADLQHLELGDAIATTMGRSRPAVSRIPCACPSASLPLAWL